ncbi:GtrA family protein [Diaphorobacter sp. HDW4A]|uniref:GtrA family protein n=1 Tax=Diaphorobacter sp. HDW4A TaxID=2714924 RepID=UPI00140C259B|nr:GtrA family protein [Diaphorobacter sp. HDW4A]
MSEGAYLLRYVGAGVINAVTGLGTIGVLTYLNANPVVANMAGFAVGMLFSFTLAKFFVFKRRSNTASQMRRYAVSFVFSYVLNIAVLIASKGLFQDGVAQALAISVYVVVMYTLMRFYIFSDR